MKEIKFRAWDKERKYYIADSGVFINGIGSIYVQDMHYGTINKIDDNSIELMQFAGLKDKNGKEIYAGDIVRNINRVDKLRKVRFCNLSARFEFVTIKQYGENVLHGELEGLNINNSEWYEIIGNIYENPELI